jgi:hypothetical protein
MNRHATPIFFNRVRTVAKDPLQRVLEMQTCGCRNTGRCVKWLVEVEVSSTVLVKPMSLRGCRQARFCELFESVMVSTHVALSQEAFWILP